MNDCDYLRDFINDHAEVAFIYMLKQEKDDCDEMYEFLEEVDLTHKFLLYIDMRKQLG